MKASNGLQKRSKKAKLGGAGMRIPDLDVERDTRLDSFHAIGKLLYNKRDASSSQVKKDCCLLRTK